MRAIGFNLDNRIQLKKVLRETKRNFTHKTITSYRRNEDFCEYKKECGVRIGVTLSGGLDLEERFDQDFYFPYFTGSGITTYAEVIIERKYEKEQYVGVCEDPNIGISLIFFLQNGIEFMKEQQLGITPAGNTSVTFSGLALSGKILFPVLKNESMIRSEREASNNRKKLIHAARNGDQTAIETLTLDDIDTYSTVSRRLLNEDVFSIVDTYFMPYGVECDLYAILGEILKVRLVENIYTKVKLYHLTLEINELQFDICVPAKELMGEPAVGRRFKGNIWLQGHINF
jgi:hypothetical protein